MKNIPVSQFFSNEYIDFGAYDLVRKIANYVDGQKNASRKILHTVREQNINSFLKVSNLGPKIQDYTQYLHGALDGTIVNVTANYIGSGNNIPLLEGDGNFGSSFIPAPAASRYIFARQNEAIKNIFRKEDTVLLEKQYFEGDQIEPKYYVPTLPMLAINGAEGISVGFAQKILPRDPKQIIKWVKQKAEGKRPTADLTPHWIGMTCTVHPGETSNQWLIKGSIERNTKNKTTVTSIPVGYNLKQYQSILDKLVDDKVIRNYDDLSDNDIFHFEISHDKEFGAKDDEWILSKLKLIKTVSENYTCIDTQNKIVRYNSMKDILNDWYTIRLEYNQKRKDHIIQTLSEESDNLKAKAIFIQGVVSEAIELRNQSESDIINSMIAYNPILSNHTKLINLPIRVLTSEEILKLNNRIDQIISDIKDMESKTLENITLSDIEQITL